MAERKTSGVSSAVRGSVGGAAGETLKRTGAAARGATSAVSAATGMDAVEGVGEQVQEVAGGAGGAVERAVGGAAQRSVGEELRAIVRDAALEVLVPVARSATTQAAKYAIRRGPQMARDTIAPKLADTLGAAIEQAGGPGAFAKGALSSVSGARAGMLEKVGIGGESQHRPWRERRLPVEESIDVVVPLETAYDRFTEFEEYATFMSRGEAVDERPDERIAWERTDGVEATAVITFHRLSDRLTRLMVTYDHQPQGLLEKTTSLFGASRRGLNEDLMRFKAFVELSEQDTETPEEEPEQQAEAPRARRRTSRRRDEDEYAEEDQGAEEEGPEGEYEEEEEPPPAPKGPARRRPAARPRQQKARRR
jgi:uncharacterized membrane protein